MKTVSVSLVLCLNIGVDPPDVIKTTPCARLECWIGTIRCRFLFCFVKQILFVAKQHNTFETNLCFEIYDINRIFFLLLLLVFLKKQILWHCRRKKRWIQLVELCKRNTNDGNQE
jgi:hypothetical protein